MKKLIKELKEELLNKKLTLVEMDNTMESITGSETSVFDTIRECLEQKSCAYYMEENKNIIVEFDIVEDNEEKTEILIKVTDIWED